MHEASLMRDLMRKIEELAAREDARRVTAIEVWLGALSHMSPAHFHEHFAQASAGSIAEGAALKFTSSDDVDHPDAQRVRLMSIDIQN